MAVLVPLKCCGPVVERLTAARAASLRRGGAHRCFQPTMPTSDSTRPQCAETTRPSVVGANGRARRNADPTGDSDPPGTVDLCDLPRGVPADVVRLRFERRPGDDDRLLAVRLAEMGFSPGERVVITAVGSPGREPLCVRVGGHGGHSRFGLRRREAELVRVLPMNVDAAVNGSGGSRT